MSARKKYLYRVTVVDPGDLSEHREVVPEQLDMEEDTGAMVAAIFYPPIVGHTRHYQSRSAAKHRQQWWAANGVTATVERSEPITWAAP